MHHATRTQPNVLHGHRMSVLRSPRSGIAERSGSQPNLTEIHDLHQVTFRNKRKQPDEDKTINNELSEIKQQMAEMMALLTRVSSNQTENMNKICSEISLIKESVSNINSTINHLSLEQDKIKSDITNLAQSSHTTEQKIQTLESDLLSLKTSTCTQSAYLDQSEKYNDIFAEIHDRNIRGKNIVITGVPEPELKNVTERRDRDLNEVSKIVKLVNDKSTLPEQVKRLGKYTPGKNRPLRATFASKDSVINILRNKTNVNLGTINIFADRTPQQQHHMKTLIEELKLRTQKGEENLIIKYIKGIPRIIQSSSKN